MPWSVGDVDKHKKNLSSEQKSKWSSIANSVLSKTGNEASAIRIANSRIGPSREAISRKLQHKTRGR